MSTQDGAAAAFADDDELIRPDDQAPYELTDLARTYLRGLTGGTETSGQKETG